jgi:LysM repeat protein
VKSTAHPMRLLGLGIVVLLLLTACERPFDRPEDVEVIDVTVVATTAPLPTFTPEPIATEAVIEAVETPVPEATAVETPGAGDATAVPPEPTSAMTEATTHTILAGETLYRLSIIYGVSVAEIAAANNIQDPSTLDIGQVLKIPAPGSVSVNPENPTNPSNVERIHTVQAGENLFRIGLRFGYTVTELAAYNGITNPDRLEIGQQIKIPPSN